MQESTENSLYHFKREKEHFLEILSEFKFTPRYHREYILLNQNSERPSIDMVIPMVCWCDIPIKRIEKHTSKYGNFGIGVSKKWAISNQINPILYIIENTALANSLVHISSAIIELGELLKTDKELKLKLFNITSKLFPEFIYLGQHIKPYNYQRIVSKQDTRKFYDEKEWRYVPDTINSETILFPSLYGNDEAALTRAILAANEKIKTRYLSFTPDDITLIIIENESDRIEIVTILNEVFAKNNFTDIDLVLNKIRTISQLENDEMVDE